MFNQPLRRDLLHRLYDFRIKMNKFTTKVTRTRGTTSGTGKKIRAQKGSGMARLGGKRAPQLHKGGKAHGAKAKVYSYPLNLKIKLTALKSLLTAKLSEGKLKIVDTEQINEGKTKILDRALIGHVKDKRGVICLITSSEFDLNF